MSEDESLLVGICRNPDDDVARLVYADWLEERGQPERAEFIRLQIQMHNDGNHKPCSMRMAMTDFNRVKAWYPTFDRMTELLRNNYQVWCECDGLNYDDAVFWGWQRGFVSKIECTLAKFTEHECDGSGWQACWEGSVFDHEGTSFACPKCCGTGTLPGFANALFKTNPITDVVLTDREPLLFDGRYLWHNAEHRLTSSEYDGDTRPADHLPETIFLFLDGYLKRSKNVTDMVRSFRNRESALDALSLVCVNYARSLHGYVQLVSTNRVP